MDLAHPDTLNTLALEQRADNMMGIRIKDH